MKHPTLYFIEGGSLSRLESGRPTPVTSAFAMEKTQQQQQQASRQAWKNASATEQENMMFSRGMLWGKEAGNTVILPPRFRFSQWVGDRLYYVLRMSQSCGLFYYSEEEKKEIRLFHKEGFDPSGIFIDESRQIYATQINTDGTVHLSQMNEHGKDVRIITAGDCVDEYPFLMQAAIYYQTTGLCRNESGMICGRSPSMIQRLDLKTKEIEQVAGDEKHDYLLPKADQQGNLYFIRRPYLGDEQYPASLLLWDIIMFPYRIFVAVFGFLDAFSRLFGSNSLKTSGGPAQHQVDLQHRFVLGRMLDISKATKDLGRKVAVPEDWQLIRRAPNGQEDVLQRHTIWYDVSPAGEVVTTDGFSLYEGEKREPLWQTDELISHIALTP